MQALARVGEGSLIFLTLLDLEEAARRTARSSFSSNFQRSSLISLVLSPHFSLEYSRKVSWEEP
jgi:hypothetical protein